MTGAGKKPKLPPVPSPAPTPQDVDIEAQRRGEDVRRKLKAKKGRRGTILTQDIEDVLGVGTAGERKKSILGG